MPESLEQLIKVVAQLAQTPHKDPERAEFVASLPPALREAIDSQGEFRQPDGSPMQADEVRKAVEQAESQLTPEQQTRLTDLTAELDRRHQELKNLAEMLKQAAQRSTASPLVLEQESTLLNQLAGQAGKMAADLSPPTVAQGKPAMVERELKTEKPAANQSQHLAELEQQLRQLDAARQLVASDPLLARQMLDDQAAQVAGAAAARELEALATDLAARHQQLQAMRTQTDQMARQTPTADDKTLETLSRAQTELDRVAVAVIDQLHDVLGRAGDEKQPPAPWTPPNAGAEVMPGAGSDNTPGARPDAAPIGQNLPDAEKRDPLADKKAPDADKKDGKPDQSIDQAAANGATDEKWWDKPTGVPVGPVAGLSGADKERHEGGDPSVAEEQNAAPSDVKNAQSKPLQQTPRQQLASHQGQMEQALAAGADEALQGSAAASELAERLRESSLGKAAPPSTATTADAGAEDRGEQPAADESQRAADTKDMLADPATQQALGMARAHCAADRNRLRPFRARPNQAQTNRPASRAGPTRRKPLTRRPGASRPARSPWEAIRISGQSFINCPRDCAGRFSKGCKSAGPRAISR